MPADVLVDLTPLDTTSRYRGIGNYVREIARAIDALSSAERRGLCVAGLVALDGEEAEGPLTWPGSPADPREENETPWRWKRRTRLVGTLRRLRPRLFHSTQPVGTPRGSFVPRIVTCHDILRLALPEQYLRSYWGQRHAHRAVEMTRYAGARRIIAVSQYTADDLIRLLGIPAARIDVVPHGVDHARFRPPTDDAELRVAEGARAQLGLGERPYAVYVGGGDPRKSLDVLLLAHARARVEMDLVVAGRFDPREEQRYEAALRAAGDPAGVRRLGFIPDEALPAVLAGAHALVFPSTYEGFGLPVLEAMATGCPVVATNATSVAEVMGDAGLGVPARDVGALASALARIATDASLRADLRRAGIARARTFTWHRAALGTVDAYARALESA